MKRDAAGLCALFVAAAVLLPAAGSAAATDEPGMTVTHKGGRIEVTIQPSPAAKAHRPDGASAAADGGKVPREQAAPPAPVAVPDTQHRRHWWNLWRFWSW